MRNVKQKFQIGQKPVTVGEVLGKWVEELLQEKTHAIITTSTKGSPVILTFEPEYHHTSHYEAVLMSTWGPIHWVEWLEKSDCEEGSGQRPFRSRRFKNLTAFLKECGRHLAYQRRRKNK